MSSLTEQVLSLRQDSSTQNNSCPVNTIFELSTVKHVFSEEIAQKIFHIFKILLPQVRLYLQSSGYLQAVFRNFLEN